MMLTQLPNPTAVFLCLHCDEVVEAMKDKYGLYCSVCSFPIKWGELVGKTFPHVD